MYGSSVAGGHGPVSEDSKGEADELQEGIFPDRLKYSIIKPLYKKGNIKDISNYRPISLLTSFSKILEKVIQRRLLDNLQKTTL
jgi:hypothetical protein